MRFSVIVPTYNRADMLRAAVDSVLAQDMRDFELVVVDDGSTDGTLELLAGYGGALRVLQTRRRGPGGARNAGAKAAHGEFLCFLDSDDEWHPRTLAIVDQVLRDTAAEMVWLRAGPRSDGRTLGRLDCFVGANPFDMDGELGGAGCWAALRRSTFLELGGFEELLPINEDNELLFRMASRGPIAHVRSPTLLWIRTHEGQSRHGDRMRHHESAALIFRRWLQGAYPVKGRAAHRTILEVVGRHLRPHSRLGLRGAADYLRYCVWSLVLHPTNPAGFARNVGRLVWYALRGR